MTLGSWPTSHSFLVVAAFTALTACGGKSGSNDDDDSSEAAGGSGITSSGGSNAGGGGATSTDGGSTSASGGSGAGGNSGAGGSNSTSNGSGGSNGVGGSSGDPSSAGGAGNTATNSSGGSGGTDPVPPPELIEGCQETCDAEVAANCPSGPTASACADGCNLTTRVPACADELANLFDCVGDNDTTSCSNAGEVVFDECVTEQIDAYACVLQEAPDPELEEPCESYCGAVSDVMCDNEGGDLTGCILYCQSIGTTVPSCQAAWQNVLACGESAEFECDADGGAQPVGCDVEGLLFLACVCESDPTLCE